MIDLSFWEKLASKWICVRTESEKAQTIDTIKKITANDETSSKVGSLLDELIEENEND